MAAASLILPGYSPSRDGERLSRLSAREQEISNSIAEAERIYRHVRKMGDPLERNYYPNNKGSKPRREFLRATRTSQDDLDYAEICGPVIFNNYQPQSLRLFAGSRSGMFQRARTGRGVDVVTVGPGMQTVGGDNSSISDWLREPGLLHGCFSHNYIGHLVTTGIFNDRDSLLAATLRRAMAIGIDPRLHRIAIFDHGRHTHALFSTINLNGDRWQTPFGVTWILWAQDNWDRMLNGDAKIQPLIARKRSAYIAASIAKKGKITVRIGKDERSLLGLVTEQQMISYPGCWYGCLPIKQAVSRLIMPRSVSSLVKYCTRTGF